MIEVVLSDLADLEAEAILRSVSAGLDADTPFSRDVEILAGPAMTERLQAMGDLPVGAAVITPSGGIEAPFLIHVVLQSAEDPVSAESVRTALKNGLRRADEWGLASVALPPLGTGAGNLDLETAASVMIGVLNDHLSESEHPASVTIIVQTSFEQEVFAGLLGSEASPRLSGLH